MAPDFSLSALGSPELVTVLSEVTAEQPVLLAFWATWCPPCVQEIPVLNEWHNKYSGRGLKILAVNVQQTEEELAGFAAEHPVNYPVLLDLDGSVTERYGVMGLPVSVYIAKGGKIMYYGFGLPPDIEELLG